MRELLRSRLVTTSRLSHAEIASALARRCRKGAFTEAERDRALRTLARDFRSLYVVELSAAIDRRGVELLARHPLRAGDAVQLASCQELSRELGLPVPILAWDQRLLEVARAEGVPVEPR